MSKSKGKIVITGGSGFLGVNLARALLDADYEVCLISRHAPKEKALLSLRDSFVFGPSKGHGGR